MRLGLMLPVLKPYSDRELSYIDFAVGLGFESLWLQEWPIGIGPPGQKDQGSGHDPVVYGTQLARRYCDRNVRVGFGALRFDYRAPSVLARSIVSSQIISGCRLTVGLGAKTSTPETVDKAAKDWADIRRFLHAQPGNEDFSVPFGFEAPEMCLASSNLELWSAIGFECEGWLTGTRDPRKAAATYAEIQAGNRNVRAIANIFFSLVEDESVLALSERNSMMIGARRLTELLVRWRDIGVSEVIMTMASSPGLSQLERIARAVPAC
jgi:hypothetical protein